MIAVVPDDGMPDQGSREGARPRDAERIEARRDRRLLRRAVLINFAGLLGKGFWPLFLALVLRWYGAAALGQFTLLYAPVEILVALCSTGFVDGIYRHTARLPGEPLGDVGYATLHLALRSVIGLGLAATAVSLLVGDLVVARLWHRPELGGAMRLMIASVPAAGATAVLVATATATMRNEGEALIKGALVPATTLGAAWLCRGHLAGAEALALAYLTAQLTGTVAALAWFAHTASLRRLRQAWWRRPPQFDARGQRRFALVQGVNVMLWVGIYSVDTLLLGAFVGDAQVARYRAGSELARLLQYFRVQISAAFVPLASRYLQGAEHTPLQGLLRSLSQTMTAWALLLAGVLAWCAPPAVRAMVGGPSSDDLGFTLLLLCGHVVIAALALAGNTLVVAGKQQAITVSSLAMTAVNVGLGVLLIPRHGLAGAAAATLLAMVVAMSGQALALRTALGLTLPWRQMATMALIAAACHGAAWLATLALRQVGAVGEWATAASGAATFGALFGAAMAHRRLARRGDA